MVHTKCNYYFSIRNFTDHTFKICEISSNIDDITATSNYRALQNIFFCFEQDMLANFNVFKCPVYEFLLFLWLMHTYLIFSSIIGLLALKFIFLVMIRILSTFFAQVPFRKNAKSYSEGFKVLIKNKHEYTRDTSLQNVLFYTMNISFQKHHRFKSNSHALRCPSGDQVIPLNALSVLVSSAFVGSVWWKSKIFYTFIWRPLIWSSPVLPDLRIYSPDFSSLQKFSRIFPNFERFMSKDIFAF